MSLVLLWFPANHDFLVGHRDINADVKQIALLVTAMSFLNEHIAVHDLVTELVQSGGVLANIGFQCFRTAHMTKSDLQG
jgi:hypothetical protein